MNQKQKQEDGQVEEEVDLWKTENQMGKYFEGEVKTEIQLLDDLLQRELIYEDEINRENKTITIGNRIISYKIDESVDLDSSVDLKEDTGKEAFIAEITPISEQITDEEGVPDEWIGKYIAYSPFNKYKFMYDENGRMSEGEILSNYDFDIDWGDGTIEHIDNSYFDNSMFEGYILHAYDTSKPYEIKITGTCDSITSVFETDIKIKQWGTTGLKSVCLASCSEIAQPTKNSFKDLEFVLFWQSNMENIPEYLFANCSKMQYFNQTFIECPNLKEIPGNIFANCINVKSFQETFVECSQINKIGEGLFAQCYNAQNFDVTFAGTAITEIPEKLFENNTKAKSFWSTFSACSELKSIPLTLFDNCQEVEIFKGTFNGCEKLEGEVPKLWLRGDNSENNNYEGDNPNGHGCYGGDTKIQNYIDIPEYWRELSAC